MGSGYVRSTAKGRGFSGIGGRAFHGRRRFHGDFFAPLVSQLTGCTTPLRKSWRMQCRERSTQDVSGVGPRTCADCGGEMVLAALLPRLSALPALHSYRCPSCGNVELDVLEHLPGIPAGYPRGTRMS
jgi:hypothetical protein